ncbi:hypothetical protein N7535_001651 [Penicillium sp. DV-2018c]|nr:hypothetical protein N7535_001651 [Penicillium sp. DV-2018c]
MSMPPHQNPVVDSNDAADLGSADISNVHEAEDLSDAKASDIADHDVYPTSPDSTDLIVCTVGQGFPIATKIASGGDRVRYLVHTQYLPEFPRSDEEGFAYCVKVGHLSKPEAERLHQTVLYGKGSNAKNDQIWQKQKTSPLPGGAACLYKRSSRSGMKCCSKLPDMIRDGQTHTAVTPRLSDSFELGRTLIKQRYNYVEANAARIKHVTYFGDIVNCTSRNSSFEGPRNWPMFGGEQHRPP